MGARAQDSLLNAPELRPAQSQWVAGTSDVAGNYVAIVIMKLMERKQDKETCI